ncbi:hypothetical protein L226DRAFT_485383 [Lentinus tigrinus ALCF2SS1-7]|uniref:FHA domain-containing protein n=1 Tax=Lentinus tigrinus ALCF2SS1-6 TaxID=1328759 RepID=A0A5C2SCR9_9APHY|nr:hypothetical protein L227DRAFT_523923 [Lentinus tigrinus ALCF2SS1-6]RPD76173.1 hypothetical protein L226DRAFT_485383 [Lentinus tigrinus ALCF2SS1-7]
MDASEVGRLGTLSLLRATDSVVTAYPIDDEELTIGRDQSCSLRLYYPAVSGLHAKVTFVERKAFLVVLGTNGVLLDDSPLFPATATAPGPTTVPLQNNSVIEIHKKRFRFTYPPKHLRPALINTPTQSTPTTARRPLRLSMIASAQVFTPRPSHDPQENLRILQTPIRSPFARENEEIVLVHSNTPRVLEEDKDLVILDEVEPEPVLPLPLPATSQYPVTPVRRQGRRSLHRAVLIRSAQRAALQRDMQLEEEEQEAEEVEETIGAILEEGEDEVQEIDPPEGHQVSSWRKSLDMVKGSLGWAFRGLSVEPKEEEEEPVLADEEAEEYMEEEGEAEDVDYDQPQQQQYEDAEEEQEGSHETEEQRPLGQFMTPQIPRTTRQPRLSLGVGAIADDGPRRVRLVAPWKVNEIEVPAPVKEEDEKEQSRSSLAPPTSTPRSPVKREKLTEEEREAIRARRRSALATPDFFKGQTPGSRRTLFPSIASIPTPDFSQQGELSEATSSLSQDSAQGATSVTTSSSTSSASVTKIEEEEDTAVLLARMQQMIEGVKQRQSLGRQSLSLSPRKREGGFSLLAPNHASTHRPSRILIEEDEEMQDDEDEPEMPASSRPSANTPRMSDLRHVFSRPQGNAGTPSMTGVREMFRPQPVGPAETPRLDGVQEMLRTPAGYRAPPTEEPVSVDDDKDEDGEDEPVEELPVRNSRGKRTPAARTSRRTPVPQSAPAKSTRASSQVPEDAEVGAVPEKGTTRRTRARTADGAVTQIPRPTRGKAAKTTTVEEPQDDEDTESVENPAPARATRRTRQATDTSTTSSQPDEASSNDAKPARRTRAKTPTPAATKGTTARRGTRTKPIEVTEVENDDDPLDSLPPNDAPAPAGRARRGTRSKAAVKQEEAEETIPADEEPAAARTTRGRRTPVPRSTPTPTTTRGAARTRAATSSSNVEPTIPEDKENTPEPGTEEEVEPEVKTKGRGKGSRSAGKAASKSATEAGETGEESSAPAPAATKTRASRTRAKA